LKAVTIPTGMKSIGFTLIRITVVKRPAVLYDGYLAVIDAIKPVVAVVPCAAPPKDIRPIAGRAIVATESVDVTTVGAASIIAHRIVIPPCIAIQDEVVATCSGEKSNPHPIVHLKAFVNVVAATIG